MTTFTTHRTDAPPTRDPVYTESTARLHLLWALEYAGLVSGVHSRLTSAALVELRDRAPGICASVQEILEAIRAQSEKESGGSRPEHDAPGAAAASAVGTLRPPAATERRDPPAQYAGHAELAGALDELDAIGRRLVLIARAIDPGDIRLCHACEARASDPPRCAGEGCREVATSQVPVPLCVRCAGLVASAWNGRTR